MFRIPSLDMLSFWIGAIVASVFWWVISLTRPLFKRAWESVMEQRKAAQLRASAGIEDTHRRIIYRQTQEMHLAASLFSLDEIVQEPRLVAPPAQIEPGMPTFHEDMVREALPYMPEAPEMASFYGAETMTLAQTLEGNNLLMLTGQPGTGKTTALAWFASQVVNHQPGAEGFHEDIPFLLHVADLELPRPEAKKPEELLTPIIDFLGDRAPVFDLPRVPGFVQYAFQSGRAILLVDGVDELPQSGAQEVAVYLRLILRAYPKTKVIVTSSPEYADGFLTLGFAALALLPWNRATQREFLRLWDALWQKYVAAEPWAQINSPVDSLLLRRWLDLDNLGLTPLEYTLKLWGAYAGDVRGARAVDIIEGHIRRLTPANLPVEAMQTLSVQAHLNMQAYFEAKKAREWVKSFEPVEPETIPAEAQAGEQEPPAENPVAAAAANLQAGLIKKDDKKKSAPTAIPGSSLLSKLAEHGLLVSHPSDRLRFSHPVFSALLAGRGMRPAAHGQTLLQQPAWSGQTLTMRYMAAFSDVGPLVQTMLTQEDPLLLRPTLAAGRLLREGPRNAPWRGAIMAALLEIIKNPENPARLRGQAISAFVFSGDPNAPALFRQLLQTNANELRRMAALGAGMLQDAKAVELLSATMAQSLGSARVAACLALVAIGSPPALEAVATALLRGDEDLRRAAAEALANDPIEGHEALREGITSQDILVRRAIIYGLARVQDEWAVELLEKVQVQDEQWVVRNAAVELLESRKRPNPHIPRRPTPPAETPWLIEFAGRYGMGVTPGQPATDLLLLALKSDNSDERMASLNYLRYSPSEGVIAALYQVYFGPDAEMRDAVYNLLSEFGQSGATLPHPMQFGLG
jgi:HEAT repeat protein